MKDEEETGFILYCCVANDLKTRWLETSTTCCYLVVGAWNPRPTRLDSLCSPASLWQAAASISGLNREKSYLQARSCDYGSASGARKHVSFARWAAFPQSGNIQERERCLVFFLITQFQKQHNKDDHILHTQGSSPQGRQYQQARNLGSILEDPAPATISFLPLSDLTEAEVDRNANPVSNTHHWQNLKHCPAQPTVGFSLLDSLPWHPCQIHIMFFTPQIDYFLYIG